MLCRAMDSYPKTFDELSKFLKTEVSPELARRALAAIFVCLYGSDGDDGRVSFESEREWDTFVVCHVADELATIRLYCEQPNRDIT